MVIFVAKIEYNACQAGIQDEFNAQAGTTFLQDWFQADGVPKNKKNFWAKKWKI